MKVSLLDPADLQTLQERLRSESDARQRDRLRAVLLAAEGEQGCELEGDQIAHRLGRSPRFVDQWLARYRAGGLAAIKAGKAKGQPPKLAVEKQQAFKARILAGPTDADEGVCTLRGLDAKRILAKEFGVEMGLSGIYDLMHRLNLSCLKPRPRHRKNDPKASADWLESAPLFAQKVKEAHPGQPLEWWYQDEARIGQQGTLTNVWAETGSRPEQVRQTEYQWVYVYAAVNAITGASSAMLAPTVNTDYMNAHLEFISAQVTPGSHAILVLDRAGWHMAKALKIPSNLTLLHLPPYSPKLNPVERVWAYMRSHYLSNRVYKDYDEIFDVTGAAWNRMEQERLKSICHTSWVERAA